MNNLDMKRAEKSENQDVRSYPIIKQRGFYSDVIEPIAQERLGNVSNGPDTEQNIAWSIVNNDYIPSVNTFQGPNNLTTVLQNQIYGPSSADLSVSDFLLKSWEPKVQMPFLTAPGQTPRKIEIERQKRLFAVLDIEQLLSKEGIGTSVLVPPNVKYSYEDVSLDASLNGLSNYLPLEIFDDTDYDNRTPEDWLSLGNKIGDTRRYPVPCKSLIPYPEKHYRWTECGVLDYDRESKLYKVKVMSHSHDEFDSKLTDQGMGLESCVHESKFFWVTRIRLLFCAEDPVAFTARIKNAVLSRTKTEGLLRYNLYVDCMPTVGIESLNCGSFSRVMNSVTATPCPYLKNISASSKLDNLQSEIRLDYARSMNDQIFRKIVKSSPKAFPFVVIPIEPHRPTPEKGCCADIADYNWKDKFNSFSFSSLLTRGEVIAAISKVRTECNKVASMSVFHLPVTKSMRLEEFEQTQAQASAQTQLFLRDSWISTLRAGILSSLRDTGKGWFNMDERNWEVYKISKLKKFMEMVKFAMQDSLRYLLKDSLKAFTQNLLDVCDSVLKLPENYVWHDDLTHSPFKPWKNPLFLLDLVIDSHGVHYSTPLEQFESTLVSLFEKGITSTYNVPQLEKLVMDKLFWSGTPILESVGEHEPFVTNLKASVSFGIKQALIPLRAYAKRQYNNSDHTPAEVKREVEKHLEEKIKIGDSIPSNLIIGPFWVSCEQVKSNLAKKRKDLSKAVLELLAKKLKKQCDEICNEFKAVSRRLYEKPNCIEDLSELRSYIKTIPELLTNYQDKINKAMTDYELIEDFNYNISMDDFNVRWTAVGWPYKIEQQMKQTDESLEKDEERFRKVQVTDQSNFEDRLDTLQMVVAGFSAHTDVKKAHEVANEVRRVVKQLKECQTLAALYNNRERLFDMPVTSYDKLAKLLKDFEPFKNLWLTVSDWIKWHESWMEDPLTSIDPELLENNVSNSFKTLHKCYKAFKDIPMVQQIAKDIRERIDEFKPYIPLIHGLRNPGMRSRHYEQLSLELGFTVVPKATLTFSKCLEMKLQDHIATIAKIAEVAGKEYSIEQALDKMENDWNPVNLEVILYKQTGSYIMKTTDETSQLLDDHIVMTQSMSFSPYKRPFEDRINIWEGKLRMTQDVMDEWLSCQRAWLYLEPIFGSEDINRQLPVESKRFQTMDRIWRKIMKNAKENPQVISLCPDGRMLENLKECNRLLDQVQKGLSDYLETKRTAFPRFYFLSDDELLEILSQTKDPTAVQPHLKKCFENIAKLNFENDLKINAMLSSEGEKVPFSEEVYPIGNVEDWLLEVERVMKCSIKEVLRQALMMYAKEDRKDWVLQWPGQIVIAGCQTYWTKLVTDAINNSQLNSLYQSLLDQLDDLVKLVRGHLTKLQRLILSAVIVIEVHGRDVVFKMKEEGIANANEFEWIRQLRYYWEDGLFIRVVNAEFPYGSEYLGNTGRLVITPLTDRCYLTLTGALHLKFGGAPAGPAGTGKTETTKDLAKAMAVQCVVFNCSDQLDYMAMGKFFKGLASAGAWACFDEFNRIDIEVLSVVAQQIATIQKAQQQKVDRFIFEGVEIALRSSCAVFVTMNPGYAGRTELPDNLKALFRPVAMMVPDYAMIAEIMLFSYGFSEAKTLSRKITTTFKLSSEQLSSQDHYDFGMRAVKTVISAAGNLKRENQVLNEESIVLRAIRDVNVPKFLMDDLKLFNGIISDLFPRLREEPADYGELEQSIRKSCKKSGLLDIDGFVTKCIQLYETTVVRHGLMLVGPTGSGKTKCYEVLKRALSVLRGKEASNGLNYEQVFTYVLNPKSITMGQLYGEFDQLTHEWTDGILSALIRQGVTNNTTDKKWYVFDGPVDAIWIENMNTVLDDNKKLCLSSGEIIKLTEEQTMMFEVSNLSEASPATVSRCGMVYLEPSILGLEAFVICWLRKLPTPAKHCQDKLKYLFDTYLQDSIFFMRQNLKEFVTTVDSNLVTSLCNILDSFFSPFIPKEGYPNDNDGIPEMDDLIEMWFIFALVWSIGATCDMDGRIKFDSYLRNKLKLTPIALSLPEMGTVFDYKLDYCISSPYDDDDDKKINKKSVSWVRWIDSVEEFAIPIDSRFADVIVPTTDTIRGSYLLNLLLTNKKRVLCIGPTGTGKTLTVSDKLLRNMPEDYLSHFIIFSARTNANHTQDVIDGKLDKRRKGVYGPPIGKSCIFFIDDLNMPSLEVYGAQPPIELIRQWCDHKGWYDRKAIGQFRELVDLNFVCAMGPPGGGRNQITSRLTRHFNYLTFTELEDKSKFRIFSTILTNWMSQFPDASTLCQQLVNATIDIYNTITSQLLPTPAKSHYTFNLRDLSKVFQGMLMADSSKLADKSALLRLWFHENCRVFQDRLIDIDDCVWFQGVINSKLESFQLSLAGIKTTELLFYGDFMQQASDVRNYEEIVNQNTMITTLNDYLDDYNQISTNKIKLVLFMDAVQHIVRISRVIRQPFGNALLLGMGGSGRQSLTKLAAHMSEYDCFQIELSKNYGMSEWREDIKGIMQKAGLENKSIVFLFTDTQIKNETFLEDINNILNSGDVPNLFNSDELDTIYTSMKPVVLDERGQPTKANLYSAFVKRVRNNIHCVICMSPIGEIFRQRLRQFPSLVNCCTIDWFSKWPSEALRSVAQHFLKELANFDVTTTVFDALVSICVNMHESVCERSELYLTELSRYYYVTPSNYLQLLGTFARIFTLKKEELIKKRDRTKTGLDKLLATAEEVEKLQEELETMRPLLERAAIETSETMQQIKKDTSVAEETKVVVQKEEKQAAIQAQKTQEIADEAQRELNEALPALEAALSSLKSLNRNDVVEVRTMHKPPAGVRMVIETVSIMKGIKPRKVAGDKVGMKVDDYWEPGKALLSDPGKFLDSLFKYDKDNIPDSIINKIQPYIDSEEFQPSAISRVSKACTSICQWVRAMYKYHFVAKNVAPKRERLQEAQADLVETQRILEEAKSRLQGVEDGISSMKAKYEECVARKEELELKCDECTARLARAETLIEGLSDERIRWQHTIEEIDRLVINIVGDALISAAYIAYMGPFTGEYRNKLLDEWKIQLEELHAPHSSHPSLVSTLGDPVKIRSWQISGLPRDALSVENAMISQYSQRWPLFIDPQGQANKWVKNMEKDKGLDVLKLTDRDFLRSLENAVRFGKPCLLENVGEDLDPALDPLLLKHTFKQSGGTVVKLGDAIIPYHDEFKLYIATKLPNPHYAPEVSSKVTLINFTLSPSGLEDQLLALVVAEERPDLEEAKNQLILSNARMRQELREIEDKILARLSASEGNPVDDIDLIKTLEASKAKSEEIKSRVAIAERTEKDIDETRNEYIPVAIRTRILFFCVTDLAKLDPMYQYSLEWFIGIFLSGISNADRADKVRIRIENINDYFTYSLFTNICRSLFERHKLLFAFLLSSRILQDENAIDMAEWRFLLTGGAAVTQNLPNPASQWLSERGWTEILHLSELSTFRDFARDFTIHVEEFKRIFDSSEPHKQRLPGRWNEEINPFQKMLVLRCIRADKLSNAMQEFVSLHLGQKFIEPQTTDLSMAYKDSSNVVPLIFVLSPGTDPAADLYKFAEEMRFSKKLSAISLGQGQGPRAEAMMRSATDRGKWVFFQNCHLAPSWMPVMERLIESIDHDKVHRDFRMWLTSMPSPEFPVSVLQNGSKMTVEPPRGMKANLLKSFSGFNDEFMNSCSKGSLFKSLLFSLCLFHGVILERRKFGPLGLNIPYEFTDGDLRICISQLKMFLEEYSQVPFKVLKYTAGHINYGGRVTDEWDRRCVMNILDDYYNSSVLSEDHSYCDNGTYRQINPSVDYQGYMHHIRSLPINDSPDIFGLHENASITFAQSETFTLLNNILKLQPRSSKGIDRSREEIMEEAARAILDSIPGAISIEFVVSKYPVKYEESMNTVLIQEVIRYNRLLQIIVNTLADLLKALKGLVVMSSSLETMASNIYDNAVPETWNSRAYPSLKPLASWVSDLIARVQYIRNWVDTGIPAVFWISGFFFPQAFLTGTLQNFARRKVVSIDTISFDYSMMDDSNFEGKPEIGCYIRGLFLEGARWDNVSKCLTESRPKELYSDMPIVWLKPIVNRIMPMDGIYVCPVYKTLTRAGTLSTTGHSTNFVLSIEVPSLKPQEHWIKRGVALICALDY
ncbi:Dynein heavy chain 1, axonemal [Trichoplax sp. H2]|nr:Dynein heavy chain 1, axonemal [Trichoplax sp. H2]|eukprot:RDD38836.1 Dynein heavy chain 1, axonemal [Trichoplax sp. H2]